MKVLADVFKIPSSTEILIRIAESKLQIAIYFTIEPIKKTTKMGFDPMIEQMIEPHDNDYNKKS